MTYIPIKRARLLKDMEGDEIIEGYQDGLKNEPEPQGNRSLSYWHGWRNGMVDGGHRQIDKFQAELARDYLRGS